MKVFVVTSYIYVTYDDYFKDVLKVFESEEEADKYCELAQSSKMVHPESKEEKDKYSEYSYNVDEVEFVGCI